MRFFAEVHAPRSKHLSPLAHKQLLAAPVLDDKKLGGVFFWRALLIKRSTMPKAHLSTGTIFCGSARASEKTLIVGPPPPSSILYTIFDVSVRPSVRSSVRKNRLFCCRIKKSRARVASSSLYFCSGQNKLPESKGGGT